MESLSKLGMMALAVLVVGGMNWLVNPARPSWSEESLRDGEILLRDSRAAEGRVLWVDARSADEFAKEHIPGAILLNESDWGTLFRTCSMRGSPATELLSIVAA
ncbi:rhodanese-like domain-containing protein [Puniceicoccus vermicola]|uniref:Rhodanese-like domain-containing protein n=1 Tax=Puniceicoccus vermicola TaxID=388746 RepID=A0A7X1AZV3_9BACT|nr:rhodanese-like domain-containing protein [Puniceicoccus vermicola]MBC2603041.1 rhodanese-like domain-containing protein [Puniceicoccus vermicola]